MEAYKEFLNGVKTYAKTPEVQALHDTNDNNAPAVKLVLDSVLTSCEAIALSSGWKRSTAINHAAEVLATAVVPGFFKARDDKNAGSELINAAKGFDFSGIDEAAYTDAVLSASLGGYIGAETLKDLNAAHKLTDAAKRLGVLRGKPGERVASDAIWHMLGLDKTIKGDVKTDDERLYAWWVKALTDRQDALAETGLYKARQSLTKWGHELYQVEEPTTIQGVIKALQDAALLWEVDNGTEKTRQEAGEDGDVVTRTYIKRADISKRADGVADVLRSVLHFAALYDKTPEEASLYWYDVQTGLYSADFGRLIGLIEQVKGKSGKGKSGAPITSDKAKRDIVRTIAHSAGIDPRVPVVRSFEAENRQDHGHWLACANGILDMTKPGSELIPFGPGMYVTSKLATAWPGWDKVEEPVYGDGYWKWSQSLDEIAGGDADKRKLLEEVTKAGIIGADWLRTFAFLYDTNEGSTGKSTFIKAITDVVGEQTTAVMSLQDMSKATILYKLIGKKLIVSDEAGEVAGDYSKVRTDIVKKIGTCEPFYVKKLYEMERLVYPHCFMIQAANGEPSFGRNAKALLKRIAFIDFTHVVHDFSDPRSQAVQGYVEDDAFKQWLLWHVVTEVELGASLTVTAESRETADDVESLGDPLVAFTDSCLDEIASNIVPAGWLYSYYKTYFTTHNGEGKPLSQKAFTRRIKETAAFKKHWQYQHNGRIAPHYEADTAQHDRDKKVPFLWPTNEKDAVLPDGFLLCDEYLLTDAYQSTRWGAHLDTFFPTERGEVGQDSFDRILTSWRKGVFVQTRPTTTRLSLDFRRRVHYLQWITRDYNIGIWQDEKLAEKLLMTSSTYDPKQALDNLRAGHVSLDKLRAEIK